MTTSTNTACDRSAIANLMHASIGAAGAMLDGIPESVRPAIDAALTGGSILVLEVDLPDAATARLVLVEPEGKRTLLFSVRSGGVAHHLS